MLQRSEFKGIIAGIFLLLGIHLLLNIILVTIAVIINQLRNSFLAQVWLGYFLGIGLTQAVYAVPLVFFLERKRKYALMKGVIIGAIITALLNGGCWMFVSSQPR